MSLEGNTFSKIFSFPFKNFKPKIKLILLFLAIILTFFTSFWARFKFIDLWEKFRDQFFFNNRAILTNFDGYYFARLAKEYGQGTYDKVTNLTPEELEKLKKYYPKNAIIDEKRFVPDFVTKPKPVPMISWIFSHFNYPENASIWLIPLLAALTVIPILLFFFEINLPFAGIGAAILGSLSIIFVIRTQIARLDTDALNLFFPFLIAYFFLKSVKSYEKILENRNKYESFNIKDLIKENKGIVIYPFLAAISFDLFMWWYINHIGFLIPFLGSFFISIFLTYFVYKVRDIRKLKSSFLTAIKSIKNDKFFFVGLIQILIFVIFTNPINLIGAFKPVLNFLSKYVFLQKEISYAFPNIKISIAEMQKTGGFFQAADLCISNHLISVLGFIGFLIAFVKHFRYLVLLLPIFLLGLSAIKGATRFSMYLGPILGAGFGYYFDLIYSYLYFYMDGIFRYISFVFFGFVVAYLTFPKKVLEIPPLPKLPKKLCQDFVNLSKKYSEAWLWTWWDYGYPLEYIAQVSTYHDGGTQTTYKTYFVATTFSNSNQTQVANTIKTISLIGLYGINKFLEKPKYFFSKLNTTSPSETNLIARKIRDYIFKGKILKNDLVLKELLAPYFKIKAENLSKDIADKLLENKTILFAFTDDEIGKFFWINRFGTWNFIKGDGDKAGYLPLSCAIGKLKTGSPALVCDMDKNKIIVDLITGASNAPMIRKIVISNNGKVILSKNVSATGNFVIEYIAASKKLEDVGGIKLPIKNVVGIYLINLKVYNSAFNQMYLLGNYDKKHFEEVYNDFPHMRVFKLKTGGT